MRSSVSDVEEAAAASLGKLIHEHQSKQQLQSSVKTVSPSALLDKNQGFASPEILNTSKVVVPVKVRQRQLALLLGARIPASSEGLQCVSF